MYANALYPQRFAQMINAQKTNGMNRYEKINSLGDDFLRLVKAGLIPHTMLSWKVYYEYYASKLKTLKKSKAIRATYEHYNICRRTIYYVIDFMEELV